MNTPPRPLRLSLTGWIAAACVLLSVSPGCDSTDPSGTAEVTVMTQNLYLGADLFLVANEPNPQLIPLRVAQLYAQVQLTDFRVRAGAIADEIARQQPDLVGLQEVTTYAIQSPSDYVQGVTEPNATNVTFDFLEILLNALSERGMSYTAVSVVHNADVELPATADGQNFFDVRYRDADVILARSGVAVTSAVERTFSALLTVPVGGVDQTFVRGYQYVQATVDGKALTFFNTHLEVGGAAGPIQEAQAAELKAAIDAASGTVLLTGDLNSAADGSTTASYGLLSESLRDVFAGGEGQPTCCQADNLLNPTSQLSRRIDFVMYRGEPLSVSAETVLNEPSDRVAAPSGMLWPTDHAGVVARFTFDR